MMTFKDLPKVGLLGLLVLLGGLSAASAQLGSRSADDWAAVLDREQRVSGLKIEEVVSRLKLKPGDVVADIGAGTGVFSGPLAQAVAPTGTLLAVDIDQGLLDHIAQRAREEKVTNIQPVLGEFDDPKLPTRVDVAFFHDVLHHIEHRQAYLKKLATYLEPDGRVVVIDLIFDRPDGPHRNQPEMHITQEQVRRWMAAAGFPVMQEIDLFDDKFFVVFRRNP
ncbi:MAG: class I SAM-dependent methyltransferase [Acidobacteria bacterium]|nr:class I SAM-dependent methyltransferase [Acidobacteriota bacterium]